MGSHNADIRARHRRKWRQWITRLEREFMALDVSVEIYSRLGEIARANPKIMSPDDVVVWLARNYAEALAVGVRRLVDESEDTLSLVRLLLDISRHNKSVTRSSYEYWYRGRVGREEHDRFGDLVGPGLAFVPKEMPQRDIEQAKAAATSIVGLANRRIAHLHIDGRAHRRRAPRFEEAYRALGELEGILLKYRLLLTGKISDGFLPTWTYDWTSVLREAWIPSGDDG